jgi:5-methylcytosine-specific restriction endonuclease McrA
MAKTKKERSPAQKMATYRNACRDLWHRSPMFWEAFRRDRVGPGVARCRSCGKDVDQRLTKMDHIEPVIAPGQDPLDAALWASRLNCTASGLQTLCDSCNGIKTGKENSQRGKK